LPSMPRGLRTMALSSLLATWGYPCFPRQASGSESSLMRPQGILTRAPEDFEASGAKAVTGCLSGPQKWYSWPSATRTLSGFDMQAKFKTVSPHCRTGQKPSHPSRESMAALASALSGAACPAVPHRTTLRCTSHPNRSHHTVMILITAPAAHPTAPHRTGQLTTTAPHRTAPHRTAPHRTAPHHTAPHRTAHRGTMQQHSTGATPHHTTPHPIPQHTTPQ
jgi:hypothetical protein